MAIKMQDYLLINSLGKSGGGRWWVFLIISIWDVNSKVNQDQFWCYPFWFWFGCCGKSR